MFVIPGDSGFGSSKPMSGCHWENREDFVSRKTEAIEEVREKKVVRTVRIGKTQNVLQLESRKRKPKGTRRLHRGE